MNGVPLIYRLQSMCISPRACSFILLVVIDFRIPEQGLLAKIGGLLDQENWNH